MHWRIGPDCCSVSGLMLGLAGNGTLARARNFVCVKFTLLAWMTTFGT